MNGDTADVNASHFNLTCVESGSERQTDMRGRSADSQRTSYRAAWAIERRKDAIPGRLDQIASIFLHRLLSYLIVIIHQATPCLITHFSRSFS